MSKAGGFGVLGAVGFSPEQLEIGLNWIDEHIGDRPYGVDIVIPNKYEGMDANSRPRSHEDAQEMVRRYRPTSCSTTMESDAQGEDNSMQLLGWTEATATRRSRSRWRPKMLIANAGHAARGHDRAHPCRRSQGRGACGSRTGSKRGAGGRVIAQGGEGGGHCGEVGSVVLWPQVVKAVAPVPVLAAGGIGNGAQIAAALALGCQGAWSGSQWLMVEESENTPVQQDTYAKASSRDTVRSRSFTGKPCRMLRNDWTDAWEAEGSPEPLGMPLQYMVSGMAVARPTATPISRSTSCSNPVGQVVAPVQEGREDRQGHPALGGGTPEARHPT